MFYLQTICYIKQIKYIVVQALYAFIKNKGKENNLHKKKRKQFALKSEP